MRKELSHIQLLPSLVSRPSLAPVFDRLQYVKTGEGGRPGESYHTISDTDVTYHHMFLHSQATVKTNLALCTSYKDGARSRETHPAWEANSS